MLFYSKHKQGRCQNLKAAAQTERQTYRFHVQAVNFQTSTHKDIKSYSDREHKLHSHSFTWDYCNIMPQFKYAFRNTIMKAKQFAHTL